MRFVLLTALATLATVPSAFAQEAAIDTAAVVPDEQHLEHIAEAGRLAGEIQACKLDWQQYYLAYMQSERRRAANEGRDPEGEEYQQRIAFIGMFFGANRGQALNEFKDEPCPDEHLPALAERLGEVMEAAQGREGEPTEGS